ncbi:MAG: hypothetical protein K2N13_04780 [Paraprevotella sp.]|nr:hypothetical protein [Paraprevotella sp.]
MRTFLYLFLSVLLTGSIIGCRRATESDRLRSAAVDYYGHFIAGEYAQCVDAIVYRDSMTDEYRSQLIDLLAQYAEREKCRTGGLVAVRVLSDTIMEEVGHVFLEAVYADSTSEEIVLPMVRSGEGWKIQ